jgi:hypothetical protein
MGSFWILITGIFYCFISLIFLKKFYNIFYFIFGIIIIVLSFFKEIITFKPIIIFCLYSPLIVLAIKKNKVFK